MQKWKYGELVRKGLREIQKAGEPEILRDTCCLKLLIPARLLQANDPQCHGQVNTSSLQPLSMLLTLYYLIMIEVGADRLPNWSSSLLPRSPASSLLLLLLLLLLALFLLLRKDQGCPSFFPSFLIISSINNSSLNIETRSGGYLVGLTAC